MQKMVRLQPKVWREAEGKTLVECATLCGIIGRNPAQTYKRYESGENTAPPSVIAAITKASKARVTAEQWVQVRADFLAARAS